MWKGIISLLDWLDRKIAYKNRIETKVDNAISLLKEHTRRLLRLEIINAIERNDRTVVHQLYDEYKSLGGNSYVKELYHNYIKGKKRK